MNHSDNLSNLFAAISKAQAEIFAAPENKQNPFLKSTYADLGAVIEAIRSPFEKHGLAVIQLPCSEGDKVGIETILTHSSGEWIGERALMDVSDEKGKTDAQVVGSIFSYLRRYAISSVARLYTEDNDGQVGRVSSGVRSDGSTTREKQSSMPAKPSNEPQLAGSTTRQDPKVAVSAKSGNDTSRNGQTTEKQSNVGSAKQIKSATCPTHLTTTILWEKDGKQRWGHKLEDGKTWCWEQPENAKEVE